MQVGHRLDTTGVQGSHPQLYATGNSTGMPEQEKTIRLPAVLAAEARAGAAVLAAAFAAAFTPVASTAVLAALATAPTAAPAADDS